MIGREVIELVTIKALMPIRKRVRTAVAQNL